MAVPVIMPKLGAYTDDVLLVAWLVDEGDEVEPGRVVLRARDRQDERGGRGRERRLGASPRRRGAGGSDRHDRGADRRDARGVRRRSPAATAADGGADENGNPFLGYIGHGGGATVAQTAGAAAPRSRAPAAPPRSAPRGHGRRSSLRARGRCWRSSASRSTTLAGSPAPGPAAASSTATSPRGPPPASRCRPRSRRAGPLTVARTIPLRGRRGTIATRMLTSLQTSAQLTSVLELDVKPLVELRSRLNEAGASPRIGVTAIVVKLAAAALREHPVLNARVTESEIELLEEINVAVAVDTDEGLVAPVVAGADRLSLEEINARIAELAARARDRSLDAGRPRRRHVHGLERRHPPGRHHDGDPQSAPGRDPLDRPHPRPARRRRRRRRSPSGRRCRPASRSTTARSTALRRRRSSPRSSARRRACRSSRRDAATIDSATLLGLYRTMLTIRLFEQRVAREFRTGEIPGFVHMYIGEEAVAAGVCANLDDDDYVTSTHRGHGHCIAKGCDLGAMMAEIYGREDGLCKGRGGSMHIADFSRGMLGANAIVGGGIALATGAGLASSVRGSGQVAVAFFGDGAANQGVLHESLNLAAIWKLPVLYVCENNGFAESTPAAYATSVPDVASRAAGVRHPGRHRRRRRRARRLRRGAQRGRAGARAARGRRCSRSRRTASAGTSRAIPTATATTRIAARRGSATRSRRCASELVAAGDATEGDLDALQAELEAAMADAVEFARASPFPDPAELDRYVYPEQRRAGGAR